MDAAAELGPGVQVAGRYRIDELIGRGGMGAIWLASDETLDRRVAIKCVHVESQDLAGRKLNRERMLREARIAARLHHQNIVTIFDVIERDDPLLVLEYVSARNLAEIIDERGNLAPDEVADIGAQVAAALVTAHHAGVVHRDIKPGNVLVAYPAGRPLVKLTDFGISHAADTPTLTATGLLTGTPAYFAPETARGEGTDARTDAYSLGATLYTALEGHPPFGTGTDNLLALLARVGRGGAPPPQHPGPLADLLGRLMHDDPEIRATAAQAEHELSQIAPPAPAGSEPPGPGISDESGRTVPNRSNPAPTTRRRVPRRRILVAGFVAAALITAGVAAPTIGPADTPPTPTPTPAAVPPPEPISIGNPQTVDPCSLIDLPALSRYGDARLDFRSNFSGCSALIRDRVRLFVEFLSPEEARRFGTGSLVPTTGGVTQARGPLTIARHEPANNYCQRRVRLPEGNVIVILAGAGPEDADDMCDIAESGTTAAVDILLGSGFGVRAPLGEERALARADACSLLQPADLQAVLGLTDVVTRPGFGNWRCTWDDAVARKTAVRVVFSRGEPPQERAGDPATFNGLQARIISWPENECMAYIAHSTQDASRYSDYVYVQTFGPQQPAELCEKMRELANAVVARLPPPN